MQADILQVCSCLRSAIEEKNLCDEAVLAWLTLLTVLDEDDVIGLLDATFAILAQHWSDLTTKTQQRAHDNIDQAFKRIPELRQRIAATVPSVRGIPLLRNFEKDIGEYKRQMDQKHHFLAFARRCQNDNLMVVSQAVKELHDYLKDHQSFLQDMAVTEQPDPVISTLVQSLLGANSKFYEAIP